jgi:hypothetical protein
MQKIYRKALRTYVYELHKKFRIRLKDAKELAPEDARGKEGKLLPFGRSPQLAYAVLASGCSPAGRRLAAAISHRLGKTSPKLGRDVLSIWTSVSERQRHLGIGRIALSLLLGWA